MNEKGCSNCKNTVREIDSTWCLVQECRNESHWEPKQDPAKHDTGKPRCDLVSPALIEAVGYVRGYGTDKYGSSDNWKQVESSRYMAALIRHLCHCMRDLNSVDPESGLPHMFHVACNVNFLVERVEVEK